MAECKHELKYLVGMADGIHCMACGAILEKVPAAKQEEAPTNSSKPKKEGKKNARK